MLNIKFKLIALVALVFVSTIVFAGSHDHETLEELQKKHPSEKAVYLYKKEHLNIDIKRKELYIYANHEEELLLLKDEASVYADESVYYSTFIEIKDLEALSYIPKSKPGKYKKVKVQKFLDKNTFSSGVFFDDSKEITFTYPGTGEGVKTHLDYTEIYKNPKFLGSYYFISHAPTQVSEYKVTFNNDVEIGYKLFNSENSNIIFTKETKGKYTTYTWRAENLKSFESVEGAPNIAYYAPHIAVFIKNYKVKGKTETVLPDIDALYNWYYSIVKDVNKEENKTLKNIVDSLITSNDSKDEKAKKIFYWVQDHIKYVAFEDGMGGFVPREAGSVCDKRYGDCKDMASIITEMLKYAGIEGHLTWIGSRDIPYRYDELATPSVDNHMIASYYNEKGEIVFLDAVGTYTPFGMPTSFIQGKQSLVKIDEGKYNLEMVPVPSANRNAHTDTVYLNLNESGIIKGNGSLEAKGYSKLLLVYGLLNKNHVQRSDKLQSLLKKGSNKFLIDSAYFDGLKDRDKDVYITYTFTLEDYVQKNGDEMYINLHLDKDLNSDKLEIEKRKGVPLKIENLVLDNDRVVLNIPDGYNIDYIPENVSFNNDQFGFSITYTKVGNTLIMEKTLKINSLLITEEYFNDWNKMVGMLNKAYRESIALSKK